MPSLLDLFQGLSPTQFSSMGAGGQQAVQTNDVGTGLEAGGQIVGAISHIQYGQQAAQAASFQAAQLRINAGQAQAQGQHQAEDVQRQTQLVTSRALAVAGASGGGASDPGVITVMSSLAKEGAYRQQVALYGGDERARVMNEQADATSFQGRATRLNSDMVAGAQALASTTTLMKGGARDQSLYQRFGGGGPTMLPDS